MWLWSTSRERSPKEKKKKSVQSSSNGSPPIMKHLYSEGSNRFQSGSDCIHKARGLNLPADTGHLKIEIGSVVSTKCAAELQVSP